MPEPVKVTLLEISNALGTAVQTRIISLEIAGFVFRKYLRDNGLLPQNEKPLSLPKKKGGE